MSSHSCVDYTAEDALNTLLYPALFPLSFIQLKAFLSSLFSLKSKILTSESSIGRSKCQ